MKIPTRLTDKHSKAKWKDISNSFDLTSPLVEELLLQYCEQFALYMRANEEIAKATTLSMNSRNGTNSQVGDIKTADGALKQMQKLTKMLSPHLNKVDKAGFDLD